MIVKRKVISRLDKEKATLVVSSKFILLLLRRLVGKYGTIVIGAIQERSSLNFTSIKDICSRHSLRTNKFYEQLVELEEVGIVQKVSIQPNVYSLNEQNFSVLNSIINQLHKDLYDKQVTKEALTFNDAVNTIIDFLDCFRQNAVKMLFVLKENQCVINSGNFMNDSNLSAKVDLSKSTVNRIAELLCKYKLINRIKIGNTFNNQLDHETFDCLVGHINSIDANFDMRYVADPYISKYYRIPVEREGPKNRIRLRTHPTLIKRGKK